MDPNTFTEATNTVIAAAQELAREHSNSQLDVLHLAHALFADTNGLAHRVAEKVSPHSANSIKNAVERQLARLPKQDPPPEDIGPSHSLVKLLRDADKQRKKVGDSYLAVDSILRELIKNRTFVQVLREVEGIDGDSFIKALDEVKGSNPVRSRNAEDTFDALNKVRDTAVMEE